MALTLHWGCGGASAPPRLRSLARGARRWCPHRFSLNVPEGIQLPGRFRFLALNPAFELVSGGLDERLNLLRFLRGRVLVGRAKLAVLPFGADALEGDFTKAGLRFDVEPESEHHGQRGMAQKQPLG